MSLGDILLDGLWSALFATAMSIRNSTPYKYILPTFVCGVVGVGARDFSQNMGLSTNWSTLIAAFAIVIFAGVIIRSQYVPPIVLICSVLPLWASVSMFNMLDDLRKVSILTGEQLNDAAIDLSANVAIVFVISLAIAIGFAAGLAVLRLIFHEKSIEDTLLKPSDNVPFKV